MSKFTKLPPDEIERRRRLSVLELAERDKAKWERQYQKLCDREYWAHGQCCAGCDHWQSGGGFLGRCSAAGIVSGENVMRSMGVSFCSYTPEPGFHFTRHNHACGLFRDEFDWSLLDEVYLTGIGAMRGGVIRQKPSYQRARGET